MAKYLVETYYTCTFKVNHYLDDINETELKNLEKRDDGKFEVLDVKLDNRKTKSLDPKNNKIVDNKNVETLNNLENLNPISKENVVTNLNKASETHHGVNHFTDACVMNSFDNTPMHSLLIITIMYFNSVCAIHI